MRRKQAEEERAYEPVIHMSQTIAVSVRVRPPRDEQSCAVTLGTGGLTVQGSTKSWVGSVVRGSDQTIAYSTIAAPLLDSLRDGYSCTLLAYGQTGSGKTHTVFGPPGCLTAEAVKRAAGGVPASWGLFPRIASELLNAELGTLHVSAIEVYQDKAYDLLANRAPLTVGVKSAGRQVGGGDASVIGCLSDKGHHGSHPPGCRCGRCFSAKKEELAARIAKRDSLQGAKGAGLRPPSATRSVPDTFATAGATTVALSCMEQVAKLALTIECTRTAASHALNARSSRSHCLVTLHLTQQQQQRIVRRKLLFGTSCQKIERPAACVHPTSRASDLSRPITHQSIWPAPSGSSRRASKALRVARPSQSTRVSPRWAT